MKRMSVVVLGALFAAGCSSPMGPDAAQTRAIGSRDFLEPADAGGTTAIIEIAIPTTTVVGLPVPPTDPGNEIHVTGPPAGTIALTTCVLTAGDYPIQEGIIVDPGTGTRGTRLEFIVTSQTTAIAPGSRLVSLTGHGPCSANGIAYNKYFVTMRGHDE
jgi:hypothetical protein